MENTAFNSHAGGEWAPEAGRILDDLSRRGFPGLDVSGDSQPLYDVNGNKVGTAELRRRRMRRVKR